MSVTNLQIAVKIEGADEAASKLQRVENAVGAVNLNIEVFPACLEAILWIKSTNE